MVDLQKQITVFTRDEHSARYLRSYMLRSPAGTDVGPKSQPDTEARADADVAMVLYADAQTISSNINLIDATGPALLAKAQAQGIDGKLPAVGGEGFIIIATSDTGGFIAEGTVIVDTPSGNRFQVTVGDTYVSGQLCPIVGIDTGETTNLPVDTVLDWEQQPPGILTTATVADDGSGNGLTGGQPEETDDELIQRIIDLRKNPPSAGNTAEYRAAAKSTKTIAIESVFAFEAIFGPGTICIAFTMRPAFLGATRIPNFVQIATVEAQLENAGFPGDDGLFLAAMNEIPVGVHIGVRLTKAALPFSDHLVWPGYVLGSPVRVSAATSPTSFTLESAGPGPFIDPKIGTTIGLYNPGSRRFVRKRFATVTIVTPGLKWSVTCVATNNASDTNYTPIPDTGSGPGQVVSPWSESLQLFVAPMLKYFGSLGPGEMIPHFVDEGTRQKRQPESPDEAPSVLSSRDISDTVPRAIASDVVVFQPTPSDVSYKTPVGVSGTLVNITVLGDFAVFQKS